MWKNTFRIGRFFKNSTTLQIKYSKIANDFLMPFVAKENRAGFVDWIEQGNPIETVLRTGSWVDD